MTDLDFIHRYVPSQNGSKRVLLLLHGTGGDESDLLPLGRELDPDAALLSPRGKVVENGSPRFFRRFAEGVFDEEDVARRANELADFITAAAVQYGFSVADLTAVGYSNGANIAAAVLLLRPEVLHEAILFRAMVPLTDPRTGDLRGKHVFIIAGEQDPIVPAENVERLAGLLRNCGSEVRLEWQVAGHGLTQADIASARRSFS